MARINPKQIELIKSLQPDFEFQKRDLQPSLSVATNEELFSSGTANSPPEHNLPGHHPPSSSSALHFSGSSPSLIHPNGSQQKNVAVRSSVDVGGLNAHSRAPIATPNTATRDTTTPGLSLSNDDRRLLARTKWLLRRLLERNEEEVEEEEEGEEEEDEEGEEELASSQRPLYDFEVEENDVVSRRYSVATMGSDHSKPLVPRRLSAAERKTIKVAKVLQEMMKDEGPRETLFVLNMLSFLKDGNGGL
jgi:hypothetical protein